MALGRAVKVALFDLDGTLLDSIEGILLSFRHVLEKHVPHHGLSRAALISRIGIPVEAQMLGFAAGDVTLAAAMTKAYRAHNQQLLPTIPLFANVAAVLDELGRRKIPRGLVTSKSRASTMISIESQGLASRLEVILTADDTTKHKPDPMPLMEAARRLGVAPADVLYVGDAVFDIQAAQAAGAAAGAAMWGPFPREALLGLGPDVVLETIRDVLGCFAP